MSQAPTVSSANRRQSICTVDEYKQTQTLTTSGPFKITSRSEGGGGRAQREREGGEVAVFLRHALC